MDQPLQTLVDEVVKTLPDVVAIYLFGSRLYPARVDEESDWDIAILPAGGGLEPMQWWNLRWQLARAIDVEKVDVVDLKISDYIIRNTVLAEGRLLYCSDDLARVTWETASQKLGEEWERIYEENASSYFNAMKSRYATVQS